MYSLIYSLFLGFGLSVGSEIYERISGATIEVRFGRSAAPGASGCAELTQGLSQHVNDFTCSALRVDAPWWRATVPQWFCECLTMLHAAE